MQFDYKSLVYFKRAAELEHMTKAADELYISQAQLSRIIGSLEKEFDAHFFDRVGKGIRLNSCGKVFYEYVQQLLDLTARTQTRIRNVSRHEQSQITIVSNAAGYMVALTKAVTAAFPELKMRQLSATSKKCRDFLKEGVADFAICCPGIDDAELTSVLLKREQGIVIYPEKHWLEAYESVPLAMLQDEPIVGMSEGYATRDSTDRSFQKYKFEPNYVVEISETSLVGKFVNAGIGISIVPRSLFEKNGAFQLRHAEIEEPLFGKVYLIWKKERALSEQEQALVDMMVDFFSAL